MYNPYSNPYSSLNPTVSQGNLGEIQICLPYWMDGLSHRMYLLDHPAAEKLIFTMLL
jgi:hypothetical protein